MSTLENLKTAVLRGEVRNLPADQATDLREAYYKAAEGLAVLKEVLEATDLPADELAAVTKALAAFDKSKLGAVL